MKRYLITNIIPIKGRVVEIYSIQAESKEDAKRKFINGNSGYFIDSTYEYLEEGINDYKSLKIDEIK